MANKIILKENGMLNTGNAPTGYKYLGYNGETISEKNGATISSIGGGSYNFNNGVTSSLGNVRLGGSFSSSINVGTDNTGMYGFNITAGSPPDWDGWYSNLDLNAAGNTTLKSFDYWTDKKSELYLSVEESYGGLVVSDNTGNSGDYYNTSLIVNKNETTLSNIFSNPNSLGGNGSAELKISNTQGILLTDGRTGSLVPVGIEYASDYSSNYTNRSLVDKGYVDNAISESFGATGATGATGSIGATSSIRRYKALLTQTGTASPTAVVLENTLGGTPYWVYVGGGSYVLGSPEVALFGITKTFVTIMSCPTPGGGYGSSAMYEGGFSGTSDDNWINILTVTDSGASAKLDYTDGLLYNSAILIEVYD